ncbi:hypothetical protein GGX14DRAFT_390938 [Mycena pura]|uniref:Uncharacterized protein n=1 Tax=Mycena pura TaxID=153505 RepID=A0AAD6VN50_9AGAR|nr:hypothetical protein GGX14DRAFT_390938 [Mycena pura]
MTLAPTLSDTIAPTRPTIAPTPPAHCDGASKNDGIICPIKLKFLIFLMRHHCRGHLDGGRDAVGGGVGAMVGRVSAMVGYLTVSVQGSSAPGSNQRPHVAQTEGQYTFHLGHSTIEYIESKGTLSCTALTLFKASSQLCVMRGDRSAQKPRGNCKFYRTPAPVLARVCAQPDRVGRDAGATATSAYSLRVDLEVEVCIDKVEVCIDKVEVVLLR